jgi:hypothetical protein
MKIKHLFIVCLFCLVNQSLKALTLYEQLCEVNQEWKTRQDIAQKYQLTTLAPITNEADLLIFHLSLLEKEFRLHTPENLSKSQKQARLQTLNVLNEYWKLRNCPRNYYQTKRIPVFIDEENRYCAVAYLMFKSGKKEFTEMVKEKANNIYIRQVDNQEFDNWQQASGMLLEELAWIQPGYMPAMKLAVFPQSLKEQKPIFIDSLAALQVYNFEDSVVYTQEEEYGYFAKVFMGVPYNIERDFAKLHYKGNTPQWAVFQDTNAVHRIVDVELYNQNVYVSVDSMYYDEAKETYHQISSVYQWTKKGKWKLIHQLINQSQLSDLFVYEGQLYMGGGNAIYDEVKNRTYHHSYLATWNGKKIQKIDIDFGGYIFGLKQKDGVTYLGAVRSVTQEWMEQMDKENQEQENNVEENK